MPEFVKSARLQTTSSGSLKPCEEAGRENDYDRLSKRLKEEPNKGRTFGPEAVRHNMRFPRLLTQAISPSQVGAPRNSIATLGTPVSENGRNEGEDLTLAAWNTLLNMIALLQERGLSRQQAYANCSVAVDLKVSKIVDLPNVTVSDFLPKEIFQR